ncbi:MAG: 3TM-type holin [Alphaproteobacteria bacterium]|nr:3TM-type holin [Alphaproteobacteria bacterium]
MLNKIFGSIAGGGIVSAAEGVANIIDQFVETDDEKRAAELIKAKLMMQPSLAQVELNKIEAGHRSIFVAGWRPFIGWVCGFALLWHFILFDVLTWSTVNFFPQVTDIPQLTGTETLVTVLLSLLGLGAMRTAEKFGRKAK